MNSQKQHVEHTENAHEGHERLPELDEKLTYNPERYNENEAHQTPEHARHAAIRQSLDSKEQGKEKRAHQAARHNASHRLTNADRETSFEQTMNDVQHDLPRSTRGFSRFIHNPTVERISEILGNTIARPDAILAGGITAFVVVLGVYFYAKYASFSLSGSETILAFMLGWLLGVLFDFLKAMLTGKR
jgi:chromatin segregation and condensation protein Rec8/ScpA/Scc1 (kleisin family)